jgi:hypothetical protein
MLEPTIAVEVLPTPAGLIDLQPNAVELGDDEDGELLSPQVHESNSVSLDGGGSADWSIDSDGHDHDGDGDADYTFEIVAKKEMPLWQYASVSGYFSGAAGAVAGIVLAGAIGIGAAVGAAFGIVSALAAQGATNLVYRYQTSGEPP